MRFLQVSIDDGLDLTDELDELPPRYAVMSHTWANKNEEVTLNDVVTGAAKSKAGYKKLSFGVKQAKSDGIDHFWLDTCCIDQANSVELTEAITSMFRWYKEALKCYVYLSDVSVDEGIYPSSNLAWESAFRNSRWFKRGWTLQELLAPSEVEFFSMEGRKIGTKKTLEAIISEITGIPRLALQGAPLSKFTVDERFRWTEGRHTRKAEDKAYCLLGIFGISMSPRYGEGDDACRRLREKIDKASLMQHTRRRTLVTSKFASHDVSKGAIRAETGQFSRNPHPLRSHNYQSDDRAHATRPECVSMDSSFGDAWLPQSLPLENLVNQRTDALATLKKRSPRHVIGAVERYCSNFRKYDYTRTLMFRLSMATAESCAWFTAHACFREWLSPVVGPGTESSRSLVVIGSTGTGKSILAAYAIEKLQMMPCISPSGTRMVLYSLYEVPNNETTSQMICVLIHQILLRLPNLREGAYEDHTTIFGPPKQHWKRSATQLWPLLKSLLAQALSHVDTVFVVLDEVYRLDPEPQDEFIAHLRTCEGNIRVLNFWRPFNTWHYLDNTHPDSDKSKTATFDLESDPCAILAINKALDQLVTMKLESTSFTHFSGSAKGEAFRALRKPDGHTFLTTNLALGSLSTARPENVDWAIAQLTFFPVHVEEIYKKLLDDLRGLHTFVIPHVLSVLIFGFNSFTLAEMAAFVDWCQHDPEHNTEHNTSPAALRCILNLCYPLITLRGTADKIEFCHRSARNFLAEYLADLSANDPFFMNSKRSHQVLASKCLSIMTSMKHSDWPAERLHYGDLLQPVFETEMLAWYAFRYWYQHLHAACQSKTFPNIKPKFHDIVRDFSGLWKESGTERLRDVIINVGRVTHAEDYTRELHRFELFSALGLTSCVQAVLDTKVRTTSKLKFDRRFKTALALSIKHGHRDTAMMLIKRYNINSLNDAAYDGLLRATAELGERELMEMILRMRTRQPGEVNMALGAALLKGNWAIYQALSDVAAFQGQGEWGDTVLHALFSKQIDAQEQTDMLHAARVLMLVKQQRVDPRTREGSMGNTALHLACWNGFGPAAVKQLIKVGSNVLSQNKYGWTPLHLCIRYGRVDTAEILLEHGGRPLVEKLTRSGNSALHWATETMSADTCFDLPDRLVPYSHERLAVRRIRSVRMLLEHGANHLLMNVTGRVAGGEALSGRSGQALLQSMRTSGKILCCPIDAQLVDSDSGLHKSSDEWGPSPLVTSDSDGESLAKSAHAQSFPKWNGTLTSTHCLLEVSKT